MSGNGNVNGRKWGQIVEVEVGEIPPAVRSQWTELYEDLLMRLEQTSDKFALAIPVTNKKVGATCIASLRKAFERHPGPKSVNFANRERQGQAFVYVWRGKAWPK